MYILPESMAPESLVQLLSTDYKFAGFIFNIGYSVAL
jgi:hypothetical protein